MGLLDRLRRRRTPPVISYDDDGTLHLLVSAPDAARADSGVLAEANDRGVLLTEPLLVRHHLTLPGRAEVERAAELLGQDGYRLTVSADGPPFAVRAFRTQLLTAMSAAQERSRMAGLAQRLGGDVAGWDALGPAVPSTGVPSIDGALPDGALPDGPGPDGPTGPSPAGRSAPR